MSIFFMKFSINNNNIFEENTNDLDNIVEVN